MGCMGSRKTLELRSLFPAKQIAFGQGVVVTGGYWSCPVMQCGAIVQLLSHTIYPVTSTPILNFL